MSTCAIIIACGLGSRKGEKIPKQFINVGEEPVVAYALEAFREQSLVGDGARTMIAPEFNPEAICMAESRQVAAVLSLASERRAA